MKSIIVFFKDGCKWCDLFKPEWEKIIEYAKNNKINILEFDEYNNIKFKYYLGNESDEKLENIINLDNFPMINGYPTIILELNGKYRLYKGDRKLNNIIESLNNFDEKNIQNEEGINYQYKNQQFFEGGFIENEKDNKNYYKLYLKYKSKYFYSKK